MSLLKDKIELEMELAEYKTQETLLHFPPLLRWLLILFILMAIPAYYVARGLSYNYWNKHYQAFTITAKQSFQNPQQPTISDVFITPAGSGNLSAAVQVTNNNLNLSLPTVSYEFIFYGDGGEVLYHETGQTFLLPNDKKYIVVPRFSVTKNIKTPAFRFTSELNWQKKIIIPKAEIQTSQPVAYNQLSPSAYTVEGTYYNNSSYQLKQVRLVFVLFNNANKIAALSRRDDFDVNPFERRAYKQQWPGLFAEKGSYVKIYPETNTLDPSNLTTPDNTTGPASDLSR